MNNNRCMFIEGIGRVHVIGPLKAPPPPPPGVRRRDTYGRFRTIDESECGPGVALADAPPLLEDPNPRETFRLMMLAADIVTGDAAGTILWSVRFTEHANA